MNLEQLIAPELTPGGALHAQLKRFLAGPFPYDRRAGAEKEARKFVDEALVLLRTPDYSRLPELVDRLWKRHQALTDPRPLPGEPAAWIAADQIKKNLAGFARWRWEPRLVEHLQGQLKPGETITAVQPRAVVTSSRTWTRAELKGACRYASERSDSKFESNFVSEDHIDALVAAEAARANPPGPYADANASAANTR